jgi:hypothetical protein
MPMRRRDRSAADRRTAGRTAGPSLEALERRDCPAAFAIAGGKDVGEASGTSYLQVTLSEALTKPVTVDYFLQGDATIGRDYTLTDGNRLLTSPTGTISFKAGETLKRIAVNVRNDAAREGNEWLSMNLFKPRGGTLGATTSTRVTIIDDDAFTAAVEGATRLAEGATGEYVLRLSSPATKTETFYVNTVPGLATPGFDYRPLTKLPLVFKPGETSKAFRIQTLADSAPETDEFFFLDVTATSPDVPAIQPFGVTIIGSGPAPLPELSIADASVVEGNSGTTAMTFSLTLSEAYGVPVSVTYSTKNGTATTANKDYEGVTNGVVTIPAGLTSGTITVYVLGDTTQEPTETFSVVLSAPTNATLARATATGTILNDDTPFTIVVRFPDSSLSPSRQAVFQRAAIRWSEIIVGDLPDVTYNGRVIDDLEITATAPYIDGPSGILGQAGPELLRTTGSKLPYTGGMEFDSADLAMMEADGTLEGVILHEMGHVLGIGGLWWSKGLATGYGSADPQYIGANGLREYRTLAGLPNAAGVPVENTGGRGTAYGHWRESVFVTELMTGYAEDAGVAMPISRMTVGSLQDMGYVVDYTKADPYTLPPAAIRSARSSAVASGTWANGRSTRAMLQSSSAFQSLVPYAVEELARATGTTARQRAFAGLSRA